MRKESIVTAEAIKTKQWLGRARSINREIDALLSTKAEARDQLLRITQNYSSDGAQSSKDPHKYDRLAELEGVIDEKISELMTVKQEILETINKLQDGRQRIVLVGYYVRCRTLEEIAVEMRYSYRNVKRWHRAGIAEIEKVGLVSPLDSVL
jgi:DNA-directed RNA polymerase specialized sigma subunit